ncbi:MAG: hypothetical protein JO269_09795 [Burkholderiaceae bacterium]|nr:hypothetical protein [Burkholderiaceae bacterium]
MNDKRLKELMAQVGMPNSSSLMHALNQAYMEGEVKREAEIADLKAQLACTDSEARNSAEKREFYVARIRVLEAQLNHFEQSYKFVVEQLEAARKDADRYRFLRNGDDEFLDYVNRLPRGEELDVWVDAAIQLEKSDGNQ